MRRLVTPLICAAALIGCPGGYQSYASKLPDEVAGRIAASSSYGASGPVKSDDAAPVLNSVLSESKNGVRHDPALDCVAQSVADAFAEENRVPTHILRSWIAWRCGLPSPAFAHVAQELRGSRGSAQLEGRLGGALRDVVGPRAREPELTFVGAARVDRGQNHVWTIVSAARLVEVSPFPKSYAPGADLVVRGRFTHPRQSPLLYLDWMPDRGLPQATADDGSFEIRQRLPTAPGRYFVQLVSSTVGGPDPETGATRGTALWFPVYVGVQEPSVPELPPVNPPDAEPGAWSALAITAYNRERARLGRPPLTASPSLAANALDRSRAILAKQGSDQARLDAQLAASGFEQRSWTEMHVASLPELVAYTLWQPAQRVQLLDPRITAIGIGAAAPPPNPDDKFLPESAAVQIVARQASPK